MIQRWVNRDPLGSSSSLGFFRTFHRDEVYSRIKSVGIGGITFESYEGPNILGFVRNDSINNFDPDGTACHSGCQEVLCTAAAAASCAWGLPQNNIYFL
jgi:hypothetical protein